MNGHGSARPPKRRRPPGGHYPPAPAARARQSPPSAPARLAPVPARRRRWRPSAPGAVFTALAACAVWNTALAASGAAHGLITAYAWPWLSAGAGCSQWLAWRRVRRLRARESRHLSNPALTLILGRPGNN